MVQYFAFDKVIAYDIHIDVIICTNYNMLYYMITHKGFVAILSQLHEFSLISFKLSYTA